MRRIVTWILSTVTVFVLLFSYHTSTSSRTAPAEQVAAGGATSGRVSGAVTGPATSNGSGAPAAEPPDDDGAVVSPGSGSGSAGSGSAGSGSAGSGSAGSGSAGSVQGGSTVAGDAINTRFGPVQVQITVAGGKITAADVLQVPMRDRKDQMINSQAVPILNQETVSAQSAKIDTVSGATYTSDGYAQSLQSAIDKAHL